jgi:TolB-like protein/DNA-binding winged helix-turn-helix (wHTH) protein/Tfp pilus assembly protein PilF
MKPRRLRFGPYEADLNSGELRKHGLKVRLQAQPFLLLALLLQRPGELVSREEVCQVLWSADTFVDFDHGLGTAVNKIREALNDSVTDPRFIETIPRRGYRFISAVTVVDGIPVAPSGLEEIINSKHRYKTFYQLAVLCSVVVLVLTALLLLLPTWRERLASKFSRQPAVDSIAVLPLLNLSGDPAQQFFADGMTEELITSLAQIGSLRIISRTSAMAYLGTRKPSAQIARELGVDALVEGSVLRSGDKVRITAQLILGASDRHLWAHSYDREMKDVLTLQNDVAREISQSIFLRLTPQERAQLSRPRPISSEVALLYFQGSYFLSKLEAIRSKEIFEHATQLDPNSAESWAGLADALHTMAVQGDYQSFPRAEDAAKKALDIDNSQAQALMVLGMVSFLYDWNPAAADIYFRRSIAARPSYAMAHALYGNMLAHRGKFDEAIQQAKLASAYDPVSILTNSMAWHPYFCARRYDEALRIMTSAVELDPTSGPENWRLARTWEKKGNFIKAIESSSSEDAPKLRDAFITGGERRYWQRKVELLLGERSVAERYGFSEIARCYMHLGESEKAIQTLEKGYEMRDPFLIFWLPTHEEFDALRPDGRFQKMLHGLGG